MIKRLKNLVRAFIQKWKRPATFIIVGIWNTIFGYSVYFCALYSFETYGPEIKMPYLWSMSLAQILGIVNSYATHKRYTFSDKQANGRKAELFRFVLVYFFTLLLAFLLMPILVEIMKIRADVAGIINLALATFFSYIAHSRFTFQNRSQFSETL
jgi:putative flippase GtrA